MQAAYRLLGERFSQAMFAKVSADRSLKPRLSGSKILACGIATLVHALTLGCALLAVIVLVWAWPNIFAIAGALIFGVLAWVLRPRFVTHPEGLVTPTQVPTLYRLVDHVAKQLGAPPVQRPRHG